MDKKKVLVACVTYEKDAAYLAQFMDSLKALDFQDFDILLVDTSDNEGYDKRLAEVGNFVISAGAGLDRSIKKITLGRNKAREFFLAHDYDYLLFVDTDVLLPKDALSKLLSDSKDVVGGVYLTRQLLMGKLFILPVVADFSSDPKCCRPMMLPEAMNDDVKEVAWIGFGCMLISRKVLEKVSMRYYEKSMSGEDVAFCVDSRAAGFRVFADFSVKCTHELFPPGDARNKELRFDSHETSQKKTGQKKE